ncbi:MAG: hypothetical protein J6127_05835 [Clostridiales bacterium]|nr:hypothetical protein [Clostridiales bacterium]
MSYKIAIGTSDGVNVDLKFGAVRAFHVYGVDGTEVALLEVREVPSESPESVDCSVNNDCSGKEGCSGNGGGCGGPSQASAKVDVISDCRCVVCSKIGFSAQKVFEKKAISVFDVECTVEEALSKITGYYAKVDGHISLRRKQDPGTQSEDA